MSCGGVPRPTSSRIQHQLIRRLVERTSKAKRGAPTLPRLRTQGGVLVYMRR